MSVIARTGQPLGRDWSLLAPGRRLGGMKQREANRLLELGVAFDLDVRRRPKAVEVAPLFVPEALPGGVDGAVQRRAHLVAQRRNGPRSRPAVADELCDV